MGLLISETDFIGTYEIGRTGFSKLADYIARFEVTYLKRIMGDDLFDLFEADLIAGVPQTAIYLTLYNPLSIYGYRWFRSEGLKSILLQLIYWEYMRNEKINSNANGMIEQQNEVSTPAFIGRLYLSYNQAVISIEAIQYYIMQNKTDYPDYKGELFQYSSPIF
jgi:hypothetical protein